MSTISRPSSNAADRAAQLQAAQKKMPAQVKEKAAPAQLKALGQIAPRDGLEKTRSMAARLMQEASQGLQAAQASGGNPFSVLTGGLTSGGKPVQVPAEMLRLMAAGQDLSVDASPSDKLMGKLAGVELAVTSLPVKEGIKEGLGVALGKVHQGTMLTLSDAADTHASAGSIPRDVPTQVAETVVEKNLRIGKGLAVAEAKLQNTMTTSLNAVRGRLSAGVDVNALVQAVLRECYLLQNEMLRDFADKVKYYNALKKATREKLQWARQIKLTLSDGDPVEPPPVIFNNKTGEWEWYELPPPAPDDPIVSSGGGVEQQSGTESKSSDELWISSSPTELPASVKNNAGFKRTKDSKPGGIPKGNATHWLFTEVRQSFGDSRLDTENLSAPKNGANWVFWLGHGDVDAVAEMIGAVPHMSQEEFNAVLYMAAMHGDPPYGWELLAAIIDSASPEQLNAFAQTKDGKKAIETMVARDHNGYPTKMLAGFWSKVEEGEQLDSEVAAAKAGLGNWASTKTLGKAAELYAKYLATEDPGVLNELKALMYGLNADDARTFLQGISGDGASGDFVHSLLLSCDPAKIFASPEQKPTDWQFLQEAGGGAADFFNHWMLEVQPSPEELARLQQEKKYSEQESKLPEDFFSGGDEATLEELRRAYVRAKDDIDGSHFSEMISALESLPASDQVRLLRAMADDASCPEQLVSLALAELDVDTLRGELNEDDVKWLDEQVAASSDSSEETEQIDDQSGEQSGVSRNVGDVSAASAPDGQPASPAPECVFNAKAWDDYITSVEESLQTIGDDAQLANTDLQNALQQQQQTLQMMSNISKMLHDTAMAVIRKMGG